MLSGFCKVGGGFSILKTVIFSRFNVMRICTLCVHFCNTKQCSRNKFIKRQVWECMLPEALL